eukprot:jgi/Ulvmu1/5594/UM023_0131.1
MGSFTRIRWPSSHVRRGERAAPRAVDNATQSSGTPHVDAPCVSLGIDLGTTNSVAAVVTAEFGPSVVPYMKKSGKWALPSFVTWTADAVVVGDRAKRQAAVHPKESFYSVKRLIGQEFHDVQEDIKRLAYEVVPDEDGAACIKCQGSETGTIYPEEVSAHVINKLVEATTEHTGVQVDRAVISVPAYFDEEQKEATVAAAQIAGLDKVKLIKEPVASAFAYGLDLQEDQTVLVFDLGGGTFDVSILEVGGGVIEVLSTGGDPYLGGDDWDAVIMDYIEDKCLKPYGIDANDPAVRCNLRAIAEAAKIKLSDADVVDVNIPIGGKAGTGSRLQLTQKLLSELSEPLWQRCRWPVEQACWQAGVDLEEVLQAHARDVQRFQASSAAKRGERPEVRIVPKRRQPVSEVLMVGGATRMPAVRQFVQNMTGLEVKDGLVDPDAAVATGAAVYAGVLSGHISELMVMEVWQAALMRALAENELETNKETRDAVFGSEEEDSDVDSESDSDFDEEAVSESEDGHQGEPARDLGGQPNAGQVV